MASDKIQVRAGIYLSSIRYPDKPALLKYLQSPEIHENTLTIPFPYHESDAEWWLRQRLEHTLKVGTDVSFAIRDHNDEMIGSIGADSLEPGTTHRAELGYWLAKPYWGQGIMTNALSAYINYAFDELRVTKLVAHVFVRNPASARVLENNGFKLEGQLREHYLKNGQLLDACIYGLLKRDWISSVSDRE
ncbi:MAG TPA: GNAT family protein [Pyrinomonadaceae bacterium]|nr:GNAT family protein [Pyrinomonadaceae bacterium]